MRESAISRSRRAPDADQREVEPALPREGSIVEVVIVEDHRMFAESLARALSDESSIDVLAVADGADAVGVCGRLEPNVALVDYQMPDRDGALVAAEIRDTTPQTAVVMLTSFGDDRVLFAAMDAGCMGLLTKDGTVAEVARAVHAAARGVPVVSPTQLALLLGRTTRRTHRLGDDLTAREHEVLSLLARGWSTQAIAAHLQLSVNTIRNIVQSLIVKLGAHSKLEAVSTAVREGIIDFSGAGGPKICS